LTASLERQDNTMTKEKVQKDKEQLEDTTEVIKSRKLEKDRQYNNKMKRQKDKEKLEGTKEVIRSRQ
jgi:hypothetical protein